MLKTKEERRFQIVGNIVMMLGALIAVIPMILILISSLTSNESLIKYGYSFFPHEWSLDAYKYVFNANDSVLHAYFNSFFVTLVGTLANLVLTTMLAYMLSRKGLPGRRVLTFIVFLTLLFNGGLVPTYINYTSIFHIKNTYLGLLIPNLLMSSFNVLLMKSYFNASVPDEILEAAAIDGAGEFRVFRSIALPMAKPIVATIALFSGIAYWNDWMNGYIYLTTRTDLYTIQNLLNRMITNIQFLTTSGSLGSNTNVGLAAIPSISVRMAMAVLGVLPIIIVYPLVQNNFVKGITLGGVKG